MTPIPLLLVETPIGSLFFTNVGLDIGLDHCVDWARILDYNNKVDLFVCIWLNYNFGQDENRLIFKFKKLFLANKFKQLLNSMNNTNFNDTTNKMDIADAGERSCCLFSKKEKVFMLSKTMNFSTMADFDKSDKKQLPHSLLN